MIFETKYIKKIFDIVENQHNDTFYNIFLKMVTETNAAGASEYEIYFNYIILNHLNNIKIRKLEWINATKFELESNYDYISYHHHMR